MKTYSFDLKELASPRELCHKLANLNCKHYTYTYKTEDEIIKHGKAADNEWVSGTWGNRVYRQTGGFPGWDEGILNDSSASKMRDQLAKHFPNINKDEVTLIVYDYTDELVGESEAEVKRILLNKEDELVKDHVEKHGVTPKLNIQKTKTRTRPLFDELFKIVDEEDDDDEEEN